MALFTPSSVASTNANSPFYRRLDRLIREVTLPTELALLKSTGRFYALSWTPETAPVEAHCFWDSDSYKVMEACCYWLMKKNDEKIRADLEEYVGFVKKAQWDDGYINSYYTLHEPQNRLTNLLEMHELYCVGHLAEFAVAYYALTGDSCLIQVVRRFVELLHKTIIPKGGYPGHQELELGLMRIYEVTGEPLFLETTAFFVRERGKLDDAGHNFYDRELIARGLDPIKDLYIHANAAPCRYSYTQAHKPLLEQDEILGHSVRAIYFLTGALHYALLDQSADTSDIQTAVDRLYKNTVRQKMYITGGLGSVAQHEAFGPNYWLPDAREAGGCYSETCASYGLIMLCEKLLRRELRSEYADVMERALFNCFLGGLGADGATFYYENPLTTTASQPWHRSEWFCTSCCPPNLVKLIGMMPSLCFSTRDDIIAVHLYLGTTFTTTVNNTEVTVEVESNYPWEGSVKISTSSTSGGSGLFTLALRIPEWARDGYQLSEKGEEKDGYVYVRVEAGSTLQLELPMTPRIVYPHPNMRKDAVAITRGPLVYCAEGPDNDFDLETTYFTRQGGVQETSRTNIAGAEDVPVLEVQGRGKLGFGEEDADPYSAKAPQWEMEARKVKLIPYFLRDNRGGNGAMRVWLPVTDMP